MPGTKEHEFASALNRRLLLRRFKADSAGGRAGPGSARREHGERSEMPRERLNRELKSRARCRSISFLSAFPSAGLTIVGKCRPALECGDYYDFLELPGRQALIAIGDVSGKGRRAGAHDSQLDSVATRLLRFRDPAD